jgi:aminoglycoside 6'-N-acetyltransferase I
MMVKIREATREDAARWLELRCALWPGSDAEHAVEIARYFEGKLAEPEQVLVAESAVEATAMVIVGIAELSIRAEVEGAERGPVGYVEGLYVIPTARHQGVARRLMVASREWAKRRGCAAFASDRSGRIVVDRGYRV